MQIVSAEPITDEMLMTKPYIATNLYESLYDMVYSQLFGEHPDHRTHRITVHHGTKYCIGLVKAGVGWSICSASHIQKEKNLYHKTLLKKDGTPYSHTTQITYSDLAYSYDAYRVYIDHVCGYFKEHKLHMTLFDKAIMFATEAHAGQKRKGKDKPYILHPLEAAAIVGRCLDGLRKEEAAAGLLEEKDVILAAAVLHDVVEDAHVPFERLRSEFGERVANLVAEESEDKREDAPAEETWRTRKEETAQRLRKEKDLAAKLLCLGDKLSNLREIAADYEVLGEDLWKRFNRKDSADHGWYYGEILKILEEDPVLSDLSAVWEYGKLWYEVFGEGEVEKEDRTRVKRYPDDKRFKYHLIHSHSNLSYTEYARD